MSTTHYQAIVAAPGFALGVQCNDDEVTGIEFFESRDEQAPTTPLAAETIRQLQAWLAYPTFIFACSCARPAQFSSAGCGMKSAPSRWAKPRPKVHWPKTSKMRHVPSARPAAPTLTRWSSRAIASKDRKSNRLRRSIPPVRGCSQGSAQAPSDHLRVIGKPKSAYREVLETVVVVGKGRERSDFRTSGNGPSGNPSAGRYQVTRWSYSYSGSGWARGPSPTTTNLKLRPQG